MSRFYRCIAVLAFFLPFAAYAQNTVTVSGRIKDSSGATVSGGSAVNGYKACFTLLDGNAQTPPNPRIVGGSGTIIVAKNFCVTPDASGVYSTAVVANDRILNADGTTGGTQWSVAYTKGGQYITGSTYTFLIADVSENLDVKTGNSVSPIVAAPTGDTTYARLDGGNQPFTAAISAPALSSGAVKSAASFGGVDECAKIAAAVTALGASGGVVDARDLTGAQTCAANPFASQTGPIGLLLGPGTITTAATWAPKSSSGTVIAGLDAMQTIIKAATNLNAPVIDVNGFNNFSIANLQIDGNKTNQSGSTVGNGIHVLTSITFRCTNVLVQNTKNFGYFFENGFSDVDFNNCSASGPNIGSGALFGNATGTSGSHIRIRGGFFNSSQTANGLFTTGVITDFEATNVQARQNTDTDIEIGDGTIGFALSNCYVDVASTGSTGILIRSAQGGSVSNCYITTTTPAASQIGIYHWNNAGDSQPFKNITTSGNTVCGLTAATSSDIAWSSNSASSAGLTIKNNTTCAADTKRYDPKTANITPLVLDQDDGVFSNSANDLTFTPQTGGFIHLVASGTGKVGIGATAFTPATPLHIQTGSGANDFTIEQTGNTNGGAIIKNSSQSLVIGIRAASGGLVAANESLIVRDVTGAADLLAISPVTGAVQQLGKTTTYNNVATVGNGLASILAKIDTTGLSANVGSTTLYTVPATGAGMYRVSAYGVVTQQATTSSTLPNIQVVWTDNDTNVASAAINVTANSAGSPVNPAVGFNSQNIVAAPGIGDNVTINVKASTTITYLTTNYASVGGTAMQYAIHLKIEYLGN